MKQIKFFLQLPFIKEIFLILVILSSIYHGIKYTIYNQDYHHSFFILSMYIDYQNGFEFFKDIFLQYGPGQIIFYNLIDSIIDINIATINYINIFFYSFNFLILFKIFKKVSNEKLSLILIFFIFLIHPYVIYPWPDYLAGTCLTLFIYFFLKNNSKYFLLSGFFLFLAIFFRSTYLINITLSFVVFGFFFFIFNRKIPFKKELITFLFLLLIFFTTLYYNEYFILWFNESIGFIGEYARETKHTQLYNEITKYIGEIGFIFFKICYYLLRSIKNLLDPTNVRNWFFIFCIIINIHFIYSALKSKLEISLFEKKIFFISILGLLGFVQSLMLMEVFRNINATIGIVVTSAFIINEKKEFFKKYYLIFLSFVFIYILVLLKIFPINYINQNQEYVSFENNYFSSTKKVEKEIKIYYQDLGNIICKFEDITLINNTNDFAIPYLCNEKFIKNKSSMREIFLKSLKYDEYDRLFVRYLLKKDELLITDRIIINKNFKLLDEIKSPHAQKNWYGEKYYLYIGKH